ncbi:MAG TPA: hypothetical protein VJR90_05750 [Gammaproteobacteria bacterium]|nr:hypothetical protein [Gammaproteobacteria bacterium]
MKNPLLIISIISLALAVLPSFAYEPGTHQRLSEQAVRQSILGTKDGILGDLDLKEFSEPTQVFPNPQRDQSILLGPDGKLYTAPVSDTILDLIKSGAALEDEFPRSLFHFYDPVPGHYDPLNIKAVPVLYSAPNWALADSLLPVAGQSYSLNDANEKLQLEITV